MKHFLKRIGLLSIVLLPLTGCTTQYHSVYDTSSTTYSKKEERPEISFEDMEYIHYDTTEFYENMDTIRDLMTDGDNADTVLSSFDEMTEFQDELTKMYSLSNLYHSIDVTDEYYQKEYSYCYEVLSQTNVDIAVIAQEILSSACKKAAMNAWSKFDVAYYQNYQTNSQDQLTMQKEEQTILMEYLAATTASDSYTISVNGVEYNASELYDQYINGAMTYDEICTYYDDITKQENQVLGQYFVDLVELRQEIAASYGYETYSDYCYELMYDREYSTTDIEEFYKEVKEYIVPLCQLLEERTNTEASSELDYMMANTSISQQLQMMSQFLNRIDDSLVESYDYMIKHKLYDLEYSENKFNGGFTVLLSGYQEPFLLNQPSFSFYDMTSLIHEFGHFNSYYVHYQDGNNYSNLDLGEITSQGLELLYTYFYKDMLGDNYGEAASDYILYQILHSLVVGCLYDEFQQEVYQLEDPDLATINELYYSVAKEYGQIAGYEAQTEAYDWIYVEHNYEYPLYYISYATSAAPALELWEIAQSDFDRACDIYLKLVDMGEAGYYTKTLEECELTSPFTEGYCKRLADKIYEYYQYNGEALEPAA